MINELKGKKSFYYTNKLFIKYFSNRIETENEKEKVEAITNLIDEFCLKVVGTDAKDCGFTYDIHIGYLENYGYYFLTDADRGYYDISHFGLNLNKAFKKMLIELLYGYAIDYEVENRKNLTKDFENRFGKNIEYNQCFYFALSSMQALNTYYDGDIPHDIVTYYENYLNKVFNEDKENKTWSYNPNTKTFELKEIEKNTDYLLSKKKKTVYFIGGLK